MVLSARMKALTEMVTPGSRVCDVGCDHGFVSVYLVQQGISPRVLAMDVRQGPLSRAQEHIRQQGLEAYIETRLSDGLTAMEAGEADALICAGMGGRLMQRILTEGREKAMALRELILQPQSELPAFRAFLRQEGYVTVAENMIFEEGKYYPMMKVVPSGIYAGNASGGRQRACSLEQRLWDHFGRLLLAQRHPVLEQYLLSAGENNRQILERLYQNASDSSRTAERIRELEEELQLIRLALEQYKNAASTEQDRGAADAASAVFR
ncbi:MAG: SAM-dependent methyltransferase [Lachnospiraceae bacterium]|nr:SAM-dependent methyltransferase [Lachnospiraceae bacterium]